MGLVMQRHESQGLHPALIYFAHCMGFMSTDLLHRGVFWYITAIILL